MKLPRHFAFLAPAAALLLGAIAAMATAEAPYIGEWSNGRGESLVITESTIKFGDDKPVPYHDITHDGDGTKFELQITAQGEVNAFPGKFLELICDEDSMEMTGYLSHEDLVNDQNAQQETNWERDSDESED